VAAVLTIPFFDTLAAIIRRKLTGRSIYATDRGHLHHCLLRRGLSARHALLLVSFLCVLTAAAAVASLALRNQMVAVVGTTAVVGVLVLTRLFGRVEAELLAKRLLSFLSSFVRGPGGGAGRRLDVHLQGTADWKALMDAVTAAAADLGLSSVRLDVTDPARHEEYHAEWDHQGGEVDSLRLWRAQLPLVIQGRTVGRLQVEGFQDGGGVVEKFAWVTKLMEQFEAAVAAEEDFLPAQREVARASRLVPNGQVNGFDVFELPHAGAGG
jgi:UDP-GlcNAc:undecaprenyl-phosphate GlcNAc-1-phosphate transferase